MREEDKTPGVPGSEILTQMREDTGSRKHLDRQKLRAESAMRRAVEARNEQAFMDALTALGIDPASEIGKTHLNRFRQLPPKR